MDYKTFYKTHHGLHVIEEVFIEGCPQCGERATILALARMRGIDPSKALSDATIARELLHR